LVSKYVEPDGFQQLEVEPQIAAKATENDCKKALHIAVGNVTSFSERVQQ
jgi:hypothetical protein